MKQKPTLIIVAILLLSVVLVTNSVVWSFEKQTPSRISGDQTVPQPFESFEKSGTYCEIFNDVDNPGYYWPEFDSGMGFAVYMNPAQCGSSPYPFEITDVHFYLYVPDTTYKWPAVIRVNIRDSNLGDSCSGPQGGLCSEDFSIPSDSAYPLMMTLDLGSPCYVNQPFFLEIVYTEPRDLDHPHPSLVMDNIDPPPDTCDNWVIYEGVHYEWYDFWGPPVPGDAIIRATGYAGEPCTTVNFTHLDTTYVPWVKINQDTKDQPLLGFRIDFPTTPGPRQTEYLESLTIKSFITKPFSVRAVKLYAETNGSKGLQAGVGGGYDQLLRSYDTINYDFETDDTLKFNGIHYGMNDNPGDSNLFYIAVDAHTDSINANPTSYNGECLEGIIMPGRVELTSMTNPDTIYNRPDWTAPDLLMTGFVPSYQIGRYRLCFDIAQTEDLPLHPGWQWISTSIDPDPCEMESVFVNCWNDLDIIIACDGSFCIPGVGCWIPGWNVSEMYKIHMADACTIQICGSKVPPDTPIPLPASWNCIAYFPECPLEPEFALASIWDCLDIVKNDDGEFCIPGVGCWIDCMEYNEGYKVHLSSADTLIYPTSCPPCPPPFAKKDSYPGFAQTAHFDYLGNTGESYSIVVNSIDLSGRHPEVGDEIGVFSPSGLCVGARVWQGDVLGIAVWQDDDRTEVVDGFAVGEQMVFKLWDKSENKEIELTASFEKGDGRFGADAYALVTLKGVSSQQPKEFKLAQNYPNPFNPVTKISFNLPEATKVTLTVYNLLGQKVKTLVKENMEAGRHEIIWDGKDDSGEPVSTGIYFYRIKAGDYSVTKKMLILK